MRFVVQRFGDEWAVLEDDRELARFASQQDALADIHGRLKAHPGSDAAASLSLRYGGQKPDGEA